MASRAETALIGAILIQPSLLNEIDLLPDEFIAENCRQIYEACIELEKDGKPVDVTTVSILLEGRTKREWLSTLVEFARGCASTSNAIHYARVVRQEGQKGKALAIGESLMLSVGEDGQEAIDRAIRDLMSLGVAKRDYTCRLKQAISSAVNDMDNIIHSSQDIPGVRTGFKKADEYLGGFQNSDLYIIGARPAMGKTALLLNLANNSNACNGIISAEQGRNQIGMRFLAIEGRVSVSKMRSPKNLEDSEWTLITKAVGQLVNRDCYLYDKPAPTLTDVIRQARKWKFQNDIKILYIDYIQRIKASNRKLPKHEQVEEIVQGLKELARELDIPVVALAQVNRQVEARPNKRPGMADLKDSGSIEQEADNIMTLYRDEVYNENSEQKGTAELNILKNRHGPTGMFRLNWMKEFIRFEDSYLDDKDY